MKKILSILLICIILLNSIPIVVSATNSEDYKTVKVEYSDNRGNPEELKLMVKDGNVYANAESLAIRLGYTFSGGENGIVIKNTDNDSIPKMFVIFSYENTTVRKMIFTKMSEKYEAPFKSIKNTNGYWIPFEYSLLLLNSGMLIIDDCILIDMPNKNIIDCFNELLKKCNDYNFEWNKDFGYENIDVDILTADSHLINMFNGILDFEGYSWAELFQSFIMDSSSYDAKYGEDLALLICTESDEELNATVDSMNLMIDMFDADGELGELLTTRSTNLDNSVEMYYEMCNNALKDLKTGNSSTAMYNRTYREFEKALDKQTWFSETGGKIIDIQNGISDATRVLNVISKLTELVGYGEEFTKQDKFALSALKKYLNSSNSNADIPKAMSDSMKNYSEKLSENIATYSIKRFWDENKDDLIKDVASVGEGLGTQANVALFAWNIASNVVPFISNGLDSADKFELAMYSQIFQSDAFLNYLSVRDNTFNDIDNITPEKLYFVSQYCYIYLKSCYTTRNAALGSLCGKSDSIKNNIKPLIEYQNDINKSIAKTMNVMKNANTTNDDNVYGFLPSDNQKYLDEFDNSNLIDFLQKHNGTNSVDKDLYNYTAEELLNKSVKEIVNLMNGEFKIGDTGIDTLYYFYNYDIFSGFDFYVQFSGKDIESLKSIIQNGYIDIDAIEVHGNGKGCILNNKIVTADMDFSQCAEIIGEFDCSTSKGAYISGAPSAIAYQKTKDNCSVTVNFTMDSDLTKLMHEAIKSECTIPYKKVSIKNPKIKNIVIQHKPFEQYQKNHIHSDKIQKYNGKIYYTSDFAHEGINAHLDMSVLGKDYIALPTFENKNIDSFVIYNDKIYFTDQESGTSGILVSTLYSCNMDGSNLKTIDHNTDRCFLLEYNTIKYSVNGNKETYRYDITKNSISIAVGESPNFTHSKIFNWDHRFGEDQSDRFLDGAYYKVFKSNPSPNNIEYYHKDIHSGKITKIGVGFTPQV